MASLSDFENEVSSIRANTVAPRSRNVYLRSTLKFLMWLYVNKKHLLTAEFLGALAVGSTTAEDNNADDGPPEESVFKFVLVEHPTIHPIQFEDLTARDFLTWIVTLRKQNGEKPGYSTFNTHRAALFNLYRNYGKAMSRTLESELQSHYKGLKRKTATAISQGVGKCKVGKDPLPYGLYKFLVLEMLKMTSREYIFARTFLIICWNLMCRAGNAFSICYDHIEFSCDALRIYFAHMKNDQMGERPRDPRHVYANPLSPAVCPILALGIYWLCFPFQRGEKRLFQGNSQYDRFRKILGRCLKLEHILEELEGRGIQADDLGSHSVRKGAATYASSGSTSSPSSTAIHLRAGWALGGVQDTYLRYEAAGDMYVGRTVCGLPSDKPEFAILPPHFKGCNREAVKQALALCFPGLPPNLKRTAEFALASILYHTPFLRATVPPAHSLLQTLPFRADIPVIEELRKHVVCGLSGVDDDDMKATGVPAHVGVMVELRRVGLQVQESIRLQGHHAAEVKKDVIGGIVMELEDRAIGAGTVTTAGLRNTIMDCFTEASTTLFSSVASLRVGGEGNASSASTVEDNNGEASNHAGGGSFNGSAVYFWGGNFHLYPEEFHLPNGSVAHAWQMWCCGDDAKRFPPLRRLLPKDLKDKNERKRLSEYKHLMRCIERKAEERGLLKTAWTMEEAINVFEACQDAVDVRDTSAKQRKRRKTQLSWVTVATLKRKEEREGRTQQEV